MPKASNPYADEFERLLNGEFGNGNMLMDTAMGRQIFALGAAHAFDRLRHRRGSKEWKLLEEFYDDAKRRGAEAKRRGAEATTRMNALKAEMEAFRAQNP